MSILLSRFQSGPIMVAPRYEGYARDLVAACPPIPIEAKTLLFDDQIEGGGYGMRPYSVVDGVLTIPIKGSLINNFEFSYGDFVTGYDYIRQATKRGLADNKVESIRYLVDSPGGMVSGCFETAEFIGKSSKPTVALASGLCASAAYAISSSAGQLLATPSTQVGSIGVVIMHTEISKMLEQEGVTVTYIYEGKHKVDGNMHEPLSAEAREDMEASVAKSYAAFVSLVADNRGIKESEVKKTEARIYDADEAKEIGLIDGFVDPDSMEIECECECECEEEEGDEDEGDMKANTIFRLIL